MSHLLPRLALGALLLWIAAPALATPPPRIAVVPLADAAGKIHLVPYSEFFLTGPLEPNCLPPHWHAAVNHMVTALDGTVFTDPNQTACGWGIVGTLPVRAVYVLGSGDSDFDGVDDTTETALGLDPNDADADGDGILDGDEDTDQDGASNGDEKNTYGTDPNDSDSDDNGIPDGIDVVLASTAHDFWKIPVLVNILENSGADGVSEADPMLLSQAVAKANQILKQAKVMLVPIVGNPLDATESMKYDEAGEGLLDSGLTDDDWRRSFAEGNKEIKSKLPGGKGMKIVVGRELLITGLVSAPVGGASKGGEPVVLLGYSPARQQRKDHPEDPLPNLTLLNAPDPNGLGMVIAHETMHALGHNPGPPGDGHSDQLDDPTPEELDAKNLMSDCFQERWDLVVVEGVGGITLSERQKGLIQPDNLRKFGYQGTMQSPGHLSPMQYGFGPDDLGDQTSGDPDYLDLGTARIASEVGQPAASLDFDVHGVFPDAALLATYRFELDTDDDAATGLAGREQRLDVTVYRAAVGQPLIVGAYVFDISYGFAFPPLPLSGAEARMIYQWTAVAGAPDPVGTRIRVLVPSSVLGSAALVPVYVSSILGAPELSAVGASDTIPVFDYDTDFASSLPTLTLYTDTVAPGDNVPFDIAGLAPNDSYDLYLDMSLEKSGNLDGAGAASDSLSFPVGLPSGFYFLAAFDSTGAFAFNALINDPPPGDLDFDNDIDMGDQVVFTAAFGLSEGDPGYVPEADLDGDGQITFADYQLWLALYNAANPPVAPVSSGGGGETRPVCGLLGIELLLPAWLLARASRRRRGAR